MPTRDAIATRGEDSEERPLSEIEVARKAIQLANEGKRERFAAAVATAGRACRLYRIDKGLAQLEAPPGAPSPFSCCRAWPTFGAADFLGAILLLTLALTGGLLARRAPSSECWTSAWE